MSFLWPTMLFLLLLMPLLVAVYFYMQRRRRKFIENYGRLGIVQGDAGRGPGVRRHVPSILFLVSLTVMTLALARPQTVLSYPRVEGTVILVFDVSGSMLADDLKPTRLDAAKAAAREFVARQPAGVQIGVVAFSEASLPVLTPTNDQDAIFGAINRLSPQRGTSLANGMLMAMETIVGGGENGAGTADPLAPTPQFLPEAVEQHTDAVMVLLTDGENNMSPDPLEVAHAAAEYGVRIHTIGIGSTSGVELEVNGFIVHTRLYEEPLQAISEITGGQYFNAQNEEDLRTIYENIEPEMVIKKDKMEVTSVFAGIGILILLLGGALSLVWFSRIP